MVVRAQACCGRGLGLASGGADRGEEDFPHKKAGQIEDKSLDDGSKSMDISKSLRIKYACKNDVAEAMVVVLQ